MQDYLVSNAATVYASGFYSALIIVALWEALAPRRTVKIIDKMTFSGWPYSHILYTPCR
jgi:hypothetical protein